MRGSVKQRVTGSWEIKWDLPRGDDGKRRQRTKTMAGRKSDAERELARIMAAVADGTYVDEKAVKGAPAVVIEGPVLVEQHLLRWLQTMESVVSRSAFRRYQDCIEDHIVPGLGKIPLVELTPHKVHDWLLWSEQHGRKRGVHKSGSDSMLSRQSVYHNGRTLRQALDMAVEWGLIAKNPVQSIKLPRPQRVEMIALLEPEVKTLIAFTQGKWYHHIIVVAVMTGLRRSEMLALKWDDINMEEGRISLCRSLEKDETGVICCKEPKTRAGRRSVPINKTVITSLIQHKGLQAAQKLRCGPAYQDGGWVFPRENGTLLNPDTVSQAFIRLWNGPNPVPIRKCRFHDLRHTFCSHMLAQGEHIKVVSSILGHASVAITLDRYGHLIPGQVAEATGRLDELFRLEG